ncbi:MAG: hypothetical protein ACK5MZ_05775, partial [Aestuariibaculum sp.]
NLTYFFNYTNKSQILYISEKEFSKIKNFNQLDYFKEKKKIAIELEVEKKGDGIYYSDNIISINKINGKSRSNI